jgi:hypothetical protein
MPNYIFGRGRNLDLDEKNDAIQVVTLCKRSGGRRGDD